MLTEAKKPEEPAEFDNPQNGESALSELGDSDNEAFSSSTQERVAEFIDIWSAGLTMASRGLGANKLRAFLTMLGVIIGVGAVIIAIAIGQGSRAAVAASLSKLGTNVLTVYPGQQKSGGISFGFGSSNTMTLADADAIKKNCPAVLHVSPQVSKTAQVKYKDNNTNTTINGTSQFYPEISNHPVASGSYFDESAIKSYKRVACLGSDTANILFGSESPVGKTISIAGQNFKIIGLMQSKGGQGFRNPDDGVYVPVTTAMRRLFGMINVQNITCEAVSDAAMAEAQTEIDTVMRKQHKIGDDGAEDFIIFNQADVIEAQNAQQDTFSALITYLAIVSLIVGGIGIMNIMLVSVTERTREIGVRKAIGATRRDILTQFLLEAVLLSIIGGILGILFGYTGSWLVQEKNGWTVVVTAQTVLLAFSFSVFIGVFFGLYPAIKASRLNPIDALRYE